MNVKVCGITSLEQMQQLQELDVDYAGMIFYDKSKRYVGEKSGNEKLKIKNCSLDKVGVFVNAHLKIVEDAIDDYGLSAVQLHGDESVEFCTTLKGKVKVIKVFRLTGNENVDELVAPFADAADYFLFDTESKSYGGTGKKFNWEILEDAKINKPFFLSGGIGLADAGKIKSFNHPYFFAVDVNSCFETAPGVKDLKKVEEFLKEVNGE